MMILMKKLTLSAGAVLVRLKNNKWEYLLLRAYSYWDFPKGTVELDEEPWAAALREVQEETGLSKFSTPFDQQYFETQPYGRGKVARYYILKVEEDSKIQLLPNPLTGVVEHHEARWLDYKSAKRHLVPRVLEVLDWARNFVEA